MAVVMPVSATMRGGTPVPDRPARAMQGAFPPLVVPHNQVDRISASVMSAAEYRTNEQRLSPVYVPGTS